VQPCHWLACVQCWLMRCTVLHYFVLSTVCMKTQVQVVLNLTQSHTWIDPLPLSEQGDRAVKEALRTSVSPSRRQSNLIAEWVPSPLTTSCLMARRCSEVRTTTKRSISESRTSDKSREFETAGYSQHARTRRNVAGDGGRWPPEGLSWRSECERACVHHSD